MKSKKLEDELELKRAARHEQQVITKKVVSLPFVWEISPGRYGIAGSKDALTKTRKRRRKPSLEWSFSGCKVYAYDDASMEGKREPYITLDKLTKLYARQLAAGKIRHG